MSNLGAILAAGQALAQAKASHAVTSSFILLKAKAMCQPLSVCYTCSQEGDGISPTAIREIMLLRELRNPHIVRLDSVHICREVRLCWSWISRRAESLSSSSLSRCLPLSGTDNGTILKSKVCIPAQCIVSM